MESDDIMDVSDDITDIDMGGERACTCAGLTIVSTIGLVHCFGRAKLPATTLLPATTVWIA